MKNLNPFLTWNVSILRFDNCVTNSFNRGKASIFTSKNKNKTQKIDFLRFHDKKSSELLEILTDHSFFYDSWVVIYIWWWWEFFFKRIYISHISCKGQNASHLLKSCFFFLANSGLLSVCFIQQKLSFFAFHILCLIKCAKIVSVKKKLILHLNLRFNFFLIFNWIASLN